MIASAAPARVLIVEDEPVILHTLKLILERHGFDCQAARTAQEALTIARSFHPNILLSDINLPDHNGIEVAIKLRQHSPRCRVVLLSGEVSSSELLEQARQNGHRFEVLAKPAEPERLLQLLQNESREATPRSRGIHRVK